MSVRSAALGIAVGIVVGCTSPSEPPPAAPAAPVEATAKPAEAVAETPKPVAEAPKPATEAAAKPTAGADQPLPGSDRVFLAPLDGTRTHLLGADANALWAVRPTATGRGVPLWRIQGPGSVQRVAFGDIGAGPKLFVAWGVGRGYLDAPLMVEAIAPLTGERTELWRISGERNEAAHLQVVDADRDGDAELALARYASKYMVEPRNLDDGKPGVPGATLRMASSWLYADVDGADGPDAIIGRVYGDARGLPGDLRVLTAKAEIRIPTENGVKSIMFGAPGGEAPAIYFTDGWVANYGKEAKARLKRARVVDGKPVVEVIGNSPDEFTFFSLTEVDLDGDGVTEIAAQGDKRVTLFEKKGDAWTTRPLADLGPVLNTAIGPTTGGGWTLFVPARPVTQAITVR